MCSNLIKKETLLSIFFDPQNVEMQTTLWQNSAVVCSRLSITTLKRVPNDCNVYIMAVFSGCSSPHFFFAVLPLPFPMFFSWLRRWFFLLRRRCEIIPTLIRIAMYIIRRIFLFSLHPHGGLASDP